MLSDRCDVHIWRGPFNGMISGRFHCIIIWNPIFFSINRFLFRNITLNPIFALLKRNERHSLLPYQYLREIWHISIIRRCCANENTTMNVFFDIRKNYDIDINKNTNVQYELSRSEISILSKLHNSILKGILFLQRLQFCKTQSYIQLITEIAFRMHHRPVYHRNVRCISQHS